MRWRILKTLLHKEALRHATNRGGLALAGLLVTASLLLAALNPAAEQDKPATLVGGICDIGDKRRVRPHAEQWTGFARRDDTQRLRQSAHLAGVELAQQHDQHVRAAQALIRAVGDHALSDLGGVVLDIRLVLLVAHVFTLNDWADIAHGLKAPDPLVSSLRLFWFSIFLLIASLLVFALIDARVVILGAIVAALGFIYSHPKLNFKGTPVASSFPHLVG